MNCVRDMVISSQFFNISSSPRLISCLIKWLISRFIKDITLVYYNQVVYALMF